MILTIGYNTGKREMTTKKEHEKDDFAYYAFVF